MPKLEDFQRGVPLTPELERLKRGVLDEPAAAPVAELGWQPDEVERELTDAERGDLRQLLAQPGWRVLQRLRKRTLRRMEETAIVLSQQNPLHNAEAIAMGWANLKAYKEQGQLDAALIENETQKLKQTGTN